MACPARLSCRPVWPAGAASDSFGRLPRPKAIRRAISQGVGAHLTRPDADGLLDGCNPYLAVADLVGAGGADDGAGHPFDVGVVDENLDLDLGDEVDRVLRASVDLGVAPLAAEAL